jgi:hypothetical protein
MFHFFVQKLSWLGNEPGVFCYAIYFLITLRQNHRGYPGQFASVYETGQQL